MPTKAEIEAGRTAAGGFTRATLEQWGVPWPPTKGWKKRLIANSALQKDQNDMAPMQKTISYVIEPAGRAVILRRRTMGRAVEINGPVRVVEAKSCTLDADSISEVRHFLRGVKYVVAEQSECANWWVLGSKKGGGHEIFLTWPHNDIGQFAAAWSKINQTADLQS